MSDHEKRGVVDELPLFSRFERAFSHFVVDDHVIKKQGVLDRGFFQVLSSLNIENSDTF